MSTNGFQLSRLRAGEQVIGAGALVLLVSTLALPWYGLRGVFARTAGELGASVTSTGWETLVVARWFILANALLGLGVWLAQASRRAPALPVAMTVTLVPVSVISLLFLIHRVVLSEPGPSSLISLRAGAVIALLSAIAVFAGAYLSLREDGVRPVDGPQEIESVSVGAGSPHAA